MELEFWHVVFFSVIFMYGIHMSRDPPNVAIVEGLVFLHFLVERVLIKLHLREELSSAGKKGQVAFLDVSLGTKLYLVRGGALFRKIQLGSMDGSI